jgi:hypothetical protein
MKTNMKNRNLLCIAAVLLTSLSGVKAATLTAWTFDNAAVGINSSPQPSTGLGTASALGMNNSYNNTNSISNPDIQSLAGSSSGGANGWRIRGFSTVAGSRGNGWSTNAPIGTQGAQFAGSTLGYYKIKVSFDVYATADAEGNLQAQYSTDGSHWFNANIISAASGVIATNTASASTVNGTYLQLVSGWNNQVTVDLGGLSGVDNDTSFAVRIVNASTGTDCVNTAGAAYNNTSGSWTLDNVVIQGQTIDTIADWSFDLIGTKAAPYNNPAPTTGSGAAVVLGMENTYTFASGPSVSHPYADVAATGSPYPATGNDSYGWRVRGGATGAGAPNSGWNTAAPVGTQGAEFDVSTAGYSNIVCAFNLYFTTQAEARMAVFYTTDGWASSNVANSIFYGANPAYIANNSADPNVVIGNYFFQTGGQGFYDNIVVDLTGVSAAENNPLFGIRIVNAATGNADCINYLGSTYNNLSGNWRYDNVIVGGTAGTPPPTVAFDPSASVDNLFTNTFTDNPAWRAHITAVYVNGVVLTNAAYSTNAAGEIVFNPAKSVLLQTSGLLSISIVAQGFGTARVSQPLAAGAATKLAVTAQAAGPSASGGTLTANPVFLVSDQYGNGATNPFPNVTITAAVGGAGGWTLGGDIQQASTNGLIAFTNLTATVNGSSPVSGAYLTFTVVGYGATLTTNSTSFNIGAPPVPFTPGNLAVVQIDTLANNTTFSIIEVNPSTASQTAPVNIVPISATGTNALRQSSSGSTGRLALSDDGTLLSFAAFADGSSATPDETLNLNRAAAALNYTNLLTIGAYTSISLGGSQARAACVLDDDSTWIAVDKGGLYESYFGGGNVADPNLNNFNNVVVKTFGGSPWVETQKAVSGQNIPVVYELGLDPDTSLYDVTFGNNLTTDQYATDFYMVSTNGGASYDILYIADQVSATNGVINKFSLVGGNWTANGSFTNSTGIDGLFATTNGDGGVNLFFTTGSGGSKSNSIVRVTDAAGWSQNISITSSNVLYTAAGSTSLKGLTFVPQGTTNAVQPIPPPVLTAQSGASVSGTFAVTNAPADPAWHGAITGITVNGSSLPTAAYDITQAGKLVFNPTQSPLLQTPGSKTIVISATGYSATSIVQALASGPAAQLAVTTQPAAPIGDGAALAAQPVVQVEDLYGNVVTNSTAGITAAAAQATWTLGGTTTKAAVSGIVTFTNLTAFSTSAITGATLSFTAAGSTGATSASFNIPAPIQSLLTGAAISGGKLAFAFTNLTGLSYSVLATNNVTAPVATWPVIGSATESPAGSGHYQFIDPNSATNSPQFYRLRQP